MTTVNTRDAALRPTLITYPTGATASAGYNDNIPSVSQNLNYDDAGTPRTVSSSTVYDDLGRVIQQVRADGTQVNTAYDSMGRVYSQTNPFPAGGTPGALTTYSYDALGRVTIITLPDSQTMQTTYNGAAVTSIDQVNRKTQRITDGLGRLVTVNEQDNSTAQLTQATSYSYNYLDNLTEVNQGAQLRKYKYDAISRLLFEKIPEQSATINDGTGVYWTSKYTCTTFNAVYQKTDARGVVSTYSYDALNRITQVSYNTVSGVTTAPTVSYVYDYDATYGTTADGMVVRMNVGTDYQERYTFDSSFQMATAIRTIGSRSYTTSYSRNEASQPIQVTYPSGRVINISHDSRGRLSGIAEPVPQNGSAPSYLRNVTYGDFGQWTGDIVGGTQQGGGVSGGVTEVYGFDANRMQLTSQKAGTSSPYTNRMDLTYDYQASAGQSGVTSTAGNTHQLISLTGTINGTAESASYTSDLQKRLVTSNQTSNGSSAQRRFALDRWGNRTGMWDAVSGGDQIHSIALQQSGGAPTNQIASVTDEKGATNYSYDAAGNVTDDGAHIHGYDSENRVVSVDGGSTASYAYDDQNRRYKKIVGSTVTHFIWEGSQVVAEHNGSTGAVITEYVYAGSRMIAKVSGSTTHYVLSDRWSTRLVLDTSGNVLGRQGHLPFGEEYAESGTQEKHHFTSYESESESGTDYAVNRQYSQSVGRFGSADPYQASSYLVNPQSWNRYSYVENDPIHNVDPMGLLLAAPGPDPDPCCTSCNGVPTPVEPQPQKYCKMTVKLQRVTEVSSSSIGSREPLVYYHLYIVTQNVLIDSRGLSQDDGKPNRYRAGPQNRNFPTNTWLFAQGGFYLPGTIDYTESRQPFHPYLRKGSCDEFDRKFEEAINYVNDRHFRYNLLLGPNSNSFVYTALIHAGLRPPSLAILRALADGAGEFPGWGQDLYTF